MNINRIINFNTNFKLINDYKYCYAIKRRSDNSHAASFFTGGSLHVCITLYPIPVSEFQINVNKTSKEIYDTFDHNLHVETIIGLMDQ